MLRHWVVVMLNVRAAEALSSNNRERPYTRYTATSDGLSAGPRPSGPSAPAANFSSRMRASDAVSSAKQRQLAGIEIN
jgi:hypothetical protein